VLSPGVKAGLTRLYGLYNSVQLPHTINKAILALREAIAAQSPSSRRHPALKLLFKMRYFGTGTSIPAILHLNSEFGRMGL
jgi:hypothetical protein